ncbi:hypothetical protein JCM1840_006500 [Sporobolomyces johnsonii]
MAVSFSLFLLAVALVIVYDTRDDAVVAAAPSSSEQTLSSSISSNSSWSSSSVSTVSASAAASVTPTKATAWIPVEKVRGVNLGGLFVLEPWMAETSWTNLGCSNYDSEWPCNQANGLSSMQSKWENHWNTFYNETDFQEMKRLGLNTVRVPLGYWTVDALIGTDYFASGSMKYVKQVLGWAKAAGLYVILDLHAAPGKVSTAGFFTDANYERAYECLANWTTLAHTDDDFSTVMDDWWGAGNPSTHINTSDHIAYDDHNYAQWIVSSSNQTRAGYLSYLSDSYPVITGEWSLSTIGGGELDPSSDGAQEFFQQFAAAQILNAEKGAGWVFWSWKTELNSATWGYWDAVQAGYIPENLATLNTSVCDGYIS